MKIEQAHIKQLRKQFAELESKEDLVKLLSNAQNMLYGEECKPFQLKSLTYYANPTLCKNRYQTFTIKKKSGADRTIHAPNKGLKSILRALNFALQCLYSPHASATGFVNGRSIVDNAKKHIGKQYVYNIDLKDFFHSFDLYRVKFALIQEIWNLKSIKTFKSQNEEKYKVIDELAFFIACLCTHSVEIEGKHKNVLPQGSPTSPILTNIICKKLDHRLSGLAKRFDAVYSRYADDITFSCNKNIFELDSFQNELKRIIEEDQKLVVNPNKTRIHRVNNRQEVTGLVVNDKVNVHRKYVKQIRMWLYYWEKYGYEKAAQLFKNDYLREKGHVKSHNAQLVNVLMGKLEYLRMVRGDKDKTYINLNTRLTNLLELNNPINSVIKVWESKGIEEAIKLYYCDSSGNVSNSLKSKKNSTNDFVEFGDIYDISAEELIDISNQNFDFGDLVLIGDNSED